jgi:hypothetical protein
MAFGTITGKLPLGLLLLLFISPLYAQDSIGMTVVARGDVEIISAGETNPLGRGDFILEQDEIIVGDRSFAVVQFIDGTKLSLRPDSRLIIVQYQFLSQQDDTATLNLVNGGLRVNLGAISSQEDKKYRILTPSGTLLVSEQEGLLTLCDGLICDQQGLSKIDD